MIMKCVITKETMKRDLEVCTRQTHKTNRKYRV